VRWLLVAFCVSRQAYLSQQEMQTHFLEIYNNDVYTRYRDMMEKGRLVELDVYTLTIPVLLVAGSLPIVAVSFLGTDQTALHFIFK